MDAILKHDRALKNGQSGSGCGSFIRAEYMRVSSSSLGIPGGTSVSNEMQEKANALSYSFSLSPPIPVVMMVAGLMREKIEINAMSAKGCPSVQSSQSNTAITRGCDNKINN